MTIDLVWLNWWKHTLLPFEFRLSVRTREKLSLTRNPPAKSGHLGVRPRLLTLTFTASRSEHMNPTTNLGLYSLVT